ncbi:hypothetical protein V144x_18710 [Gimesia aquarii]|uniref:Uncharacterized protein n=1 Tax=Gimesia aquarii TaxID=2527964 RepID=A0A517VTS9_9PLAN|nr:hypothetical protein V144x_18710 [Gimesia aquarii]
MLPVSLTTTKNAKGTKTTFFYVFKFVLSTSAFLIRPVNRWYRASERHHAGGAPEGESECQSGVEQE